MNVRRMGVFLWAIKHCTLGINYTKLQERKRSGMTIRIKIAAVGDILMLESQIASAKIQGEDKYSFHSMFENVESYIKDADLAIGNLETTLSGREQRYQQRNPKTGYPSFNCPDELTAALKKAGFQVMITANNHCLDRGVKGLKRTLDILDQHGLEHTGTFNSLLASKKLLIQDVKGIKIGILAYTRGVNFNPVPKSEPWLVNRLREKKMFGDIRRLKEENVDLVIVSLHFGKEFRHTTVQHQRESVEKLFKNGADVILGHHPHVLQPMVMKQVKDRYGELKNRFAIYSLGNFISDKLLHNPQTLSGVILYLTAQKDDEGKVSIVGVDYIPTWVQRKEANGRVKFKVLPIPEFLNKSNSGSLTGEEINMMKNALKKTTKILG
jgi:poly-gamma-glutamate capsule biosynthesis protein CapA/YwtB (metallophosphatase superfamily)